MSRTTSLSKKIFLFILLFSFFSKLNGSEQRKKNYNVLFYALNMHLLNQEEFSWKGTVTIYAHLNQDTDTLILDAQKTVEIRTISINDENKTFLHHPPFLKIPLRLKKNSRVKIQLSFISTPPFSGNLPWEGGYVSLRTSRGCWWAGIACQEAGASLWWPCKTDWNDKADSGCIIRITGIPSSCNAVANGRLLYQKTHTDSLQEFTWQVKNPIHPYNMNITLGPFVHFSDTLFSQVKNQFLTLDYYVLPEHKEKAIKHFSMVKPMIHCLEKALGPYPFYEDGYKLIETPYLGMEHQSAVAYGNQYKEGYLGDKKMTAGLDFDFIILHESIHEWFGNFLTASDISDMWIQEAMTTWAESLYASCRYGDSLQEKYVQFMRYRIQNDAPMVGDSKASQPGSADMYPKGALMIQGLRYLSKDKNLFLSFPKALLNHFAQHPVGTKDFIDFSEKYFGIPLRAYFNTYLFQASPPVLMVKKAGKNRYELQWKKVKKGFGFPIYLDKEKTIFLNSGQKKFLVISDLETFKALQKGYFLWEES